MAKKTTVDVMANVLADQLCIGVEEVKPQYSLSHDLNMDSLDLVEIVMALEETFVIEIADADADKFRTVGDIQAYLERKVR